MKYYKYNPKLYNISVKNSWLTAFFPNGKKPNGYWDSYDNCKMEAKKYVRRNDFKKENQCAYNSCTKNKWIDDFFPNKKIKD